VLPDLDSTEEHVELNTGDLVVMYTDGVTEAFNPQYEAFGEERLTKVVRECRGLSAGAIRDQILKEVRAFAGKAPQSDDITLVIIRVLRGI
ncbi:MAG: serine/threonine-protein phosphatase, partial [Methanoregula sp.]|nr:serine/threonine-protein phosphatase [Methanoregula sp.]